MALPREGIHFWATINVPTIAAVIKKVPKKPTKCQGPSGCNGANRNNIKLSNAPNSILPKSTCISFVSRRSIGSNKMILAISENIIARCGGLHTIKGLDKSSTPNNRCQSSSNGAERGTSNKTRASVRQRFSLVWQYPDIPNTTATSMDEYNKRWGGSQKDSLPIAPCHQAS